MTAMTTILGMLPLALGGSNVGNAYYYPLARTVMGGLAASTILTLIILPYLYLQIDTVGAWLRRLWAESGGRRAAVPVGTPAPAGGAAFPSLHTGPTDTPRRQ